VFKTRSKGGVVQTRCATSLQRPSLRGTKQSPIKPCTPVLLAIASCLAMTTPTQRGTSFVETRCIASLRAVSLRFCLEHDSQDFRIYRIVLPIRASSNIIMNYEL
jgi:hypothetical protein